MDPPTSVAVSEVKADSITLTWRNPSNQNFQFLIVEYKKKQETEWTSEPVKKNQETTTLSGLELDTEYKIRVTVMGKQGCSVSSDVVTAVNAKTTMIPPTNVVVKEVKADSITLTWTNPCDQQCTFFILEYKTKQETEWTSDPLKKTQETATLSGLEPDTEYHIRVMAVGKQGGSVSSDTVTVLTAKTTMKPPTNLEVKKVKADSLTLTWKKPSDQECRFLIVEYRMTDETEWTESDPVKKDLETATLSGLELDTEYEIRVTAMGKQGCSVSSDIVTAVSAKTTMKPATNLEVKEVKADSLILTWKKPSDQECRFLIVEYRMTDDTEWTESDPVKKDLETATLSGLEPGTVYEIKLTAVGKRGCSVSSDVVTAKTTISPPAEVKVEDMTVYSVSSNITAKTTTSPSTEVKVEDMRAYSVSRDVTAKTTLIPPTLVKPEKPVQTYSVSRDYNRDYSRVTAKPITGPPTNVEVIEKKANSITLSWLNPQRCEDVKQYLIEYKEGESSCWQKQGTEKEVYKCTLKNLKLNTSYSIRMCTDAKSGMSEYGEMILAKTMTGPQDKNRFTPLPSDHPPVFLLNLQKASTVQFNKMLFGQAHPLHIPPNKTIMFVGATGSGKTTLINGIINYILGVDWDNEWRFKLIDEVTDKTQAHSQTSEVTAYQIHRSDDFQVPYSLTIIDTPGFGDTRGIKYDKEITDKIKQFFTNKDGIHAIDAVCFVVQAALARLTHTQKYVFDAILSVFGKDIASNIITLVTFADAKSPPVLEAIKEADIPCAKKTDGSPIYFKFNNSALFANNMKDNKDGEESCDEDKEEDFDYMFWKMGKSSLKKFFTHLMTMKTQSLSLTKEVLQERDRLEATVEGLQPLIQKGLSKMEEIRTTEAALNKHKNQVEENRDFEYEVEVEKPQKINIPKGEYITNCLQCAFTCHRRCGIAKDDDKRGCVAIGPNGCCNVCPGKCIWNIHHNMEYRFETKRVKEKRTYKELKAKFEEALGEQMTTEKMVSQLKIEYQLVQEKVVEMMKTVNECLTCLKKIALRPDPLSTTEYIDLMIQSEKQECRPGYKERLQELDEIRKKALLMQNMAKSDKPAFSIKDCPTTVFGNIRKWFHI